MRIFKTLQKIAGFGKNRTLTDVQRIVELFKGQHYSNLFAFMLHIVLRKIHEQTIKLNQFQWVYFVENCITALRTFMYGIHGFYRNDETAMRNARMALLAHASVMSESLEELQQMEAAFDAIKDNLPKIPDTE